jgi:hypothetical protein
MSAQATVVALFRACGFYVSVKSENRKARGTKGQPDFQAMHPRLSAPTSWEHKRDGELVSPEQLEFERHWTESGGLYGRGDLDDAKAWLERHGFRIPDE